MLIGKLQFVARNKGTNVLFLSSYQQGNHTA